MRFLLESGSWAALVPHAPLLLPRINEDLRFPELHGALSHVRDRHADLVVLVSPHGSAGGVYDGYGSLATLGINGYETDLHADPRWSRGLQDLTGFPALPGPADHGITVPVLLDAIPDAPLVCCALEETTGPGRAFTPDTEAAAERLVQAIVKIAADRRVGVILSAHTSASLSPRAPLTDSAEGHSFEEEFRRRFDDDVQSLANLDGGFVAAADPCGRSLFAVLTGLLPAGVGGNVHAYDDSTGVGYLVATVDA